MKISNDVRGIFNALEHLALQGERQLARDALAVLREEAIWAELSRLAEKQGVTGGMRAARSAAEECAGVTCDTATVTAMRP